MAHELFANDATSTLAGGITNIATTANLSSGSGALFPHPGASEYFTATFRDASSGLLTEIVHVTDVTGDVVTMIRAQEGTTAQNWAAGDLFDNLITAGTMANMQQTSDLQNERYGYAVDTGTSGNLVITLSPTPSSFAFIVGMPIRIRVSNNSTGATTLNVNGLGARNLINPNNTVMSIGQVLASSIISVVYDGTNFQLQSITNQRLPPPTYFQGVGAFSYSVPAGVWNVRIQAVGGGGGGGGTDGSQAAAGGGSGGYGQVDIAVVPGQTITGAVGGGGGGGAVGGVGATGADTTATYNATTHTASGGTGGGFSANPGGGGGGGASGWDFACTGGAGSDGTSSSNVLGGAGGASFFGGGGRMAKGTPVPGQAPGSGGGGTYGPSPVVGGAGAPGCVIITPVPLQ